MPGTELALTSLFRLDWSGIKHGTAKEGVEGCLSLGQATLTPSPFASSRQSSTWLSCFLLLQQWGLIAGRFKEGRDKDPTKWQLAAAPPPCTPDEATLGVSLPTPCTKHLTLRKPRPQGGAQKGPDRTPGGGLVPGAAPPRCRSQPSGPGPHLGGRTRGGVGGGLHISRPRRTPKN